MLQIHLQSQRYTEGAQTEDFNQNSVCVCACVCMYVLLCCFQRLIHHRLNKTRRVCHCEEKKPLADVSSMCVNRLAFRKRLFSQAQ